MTRVGLLAPMEIELEPLVRLLNLDRDDDGSRYRGRTAGVEVVAMLTNIGMTAGAQAARRILEHGIDWVMVVGVAGGVASSVGIGDVIVPEVVIDRTTDRTFRPALIGAIAPRGVLSCGDDLITDPEVLAGMAANGVLAVDMETAAVAAVCEGAGCSWSVFRGISDRAADGLVDDALFALTRPDGTADPDAMARYLGANPERTAILAQLAHDTRLATEAAATAAIEACAAL
jgi:adenosylhomocysteine nucleosidase